MIHRSYSLRRWSSTVVIYGPVFCWSMFIYRGQLLRLNFYIIPWFLNLMRLSATWLIFWNQSRLTSLSLFFLLNVYVFIGTFCFNFFFLAISFLLSLRYSTLNSLLRWLAYFIWCLILYLKIWLIGYVLMLIHL